MLVLACDGELAWRNRNLESLERREEGRHSRAELQGWAGPGRGKATAKAAASSSELELHSIPFRERGFVSSLFSGAIHSWSPLNLNGAAARRLRVPVVHRPPSIVPRPSSLVPRPDVVPNRQSLSIAEQSRAEPGNTQRGRSVARAPPLQCSRCSREAKRPQGQGQALVFSPAFFSGRTRARFRARPRAAGAGAGKGAGRA